MKYAGLTRIAGRRAADSSRTAITTGRKRVAMEPSSLALKYREVLACVLLDIVRDHHQCMPGACRDRPGWDRVRLGLKGGDSVVVDVWSRGDQDISRAPRELEVYRRDELLCWRPLAGHVHGAASAPANDDRPLRLAS
jgi:hypothetical protein